MNHAARPEEMPGRLTARDAVRAALTHDRERYLAIIRGRAGGGRRGRSRFNDRRASYRRTLSSALGSPAAYASVRKRSYLASPNR